MHTWATQLPAAMGWLPLVGVLAGAIFVLVSPVRFRAAWWLIAAALALGCLIDQHRLQPWAYQSVIYGCVFASMRPSMARQILIPLAASVYIYSAAGKLDYQFVHSVGQDFLNVPLGWLGAVDAIDKNTKATLAHVLPAVELFVGVMLLFAKTRRLAGGLAICLHVSLLILLSPAGLHHSHGVLIWNVLLMVQAWYLFVAPSHNDLHDNRLLYRRLFRLPFRRSDEGGGLGRGIARILVIIALIAPASERAGLWDHWTSWALYSPHSSRVAVEFHRSVTNELPKSAQDHLGEDDDEDGWRSLALDAWSLDSLGVPVYPQARYQLALVNELAARGDIENSAVRCTVRGVSNRVNGRREEKPLLGRKEIEKALENYWLVPR
jgi:hypothetical protein